MKQALLCATLIGGALLFPTGGYASCGFISPEGPTSVIDFGRSITGIAAQLLGLGGDGEQKAELIAKEEENNEKASGGGGNASKTNTQDQLGDALDGATTLQGSGTAGASEFSGSAFAYVQSVLFGTSGGVQFEPVQQIMAAPSIDEVRQGVMNTFFADPTKAEQSTRVYQEKVAENRQNYAQEAATRHITLSNNVKGYIQNDLSVIAVAPVSGDGELGSIAVDSHTLEQMIKMELVELAIQIEMMEADAIQFMMHQPITLMSKTKN